jgi:hypothetical protein
MGELTDLFKAIQQSRTVQELIIDGRKYTDHAIVPVDDPLPDTLKVHNLTSLVEYIRLWSAKDALSRPLMVLIESPVKVAVVSELIKPFEDRACYLEADEGFVWKGANQYFDQESFIIMLLTQFVQDDKTAELIKIVGNIVDSMVTKATDDGVTQQVTAEVGIVKRENIAITPRYDLKPFRSFSETDQASSPFLLRMRSGQKEGAMPTIALYEADGGAWRNTAMANIKSFLAGKLPEGMVVLA